jgi:rhamnose utilization protein RhaD (predicted bifunctional aldolase and dehydrogenase)/NAD(P)-dependent dehydrogenase (short-subunit alcohol dehydrogenase family)
VQDEWDDQHASTLSDPVAECVYCTRLIGSDPGLVLHGGGNSSVKAPREDVTGRMVDAIHVKGSGWDMATIEAPGLAPLDLPRLRELLELSTLSDPDMMRELAAAKLDPAAPNPSVESLLHAFLPHRAVQHSHADVIVALTNVADGANIVDDVYGDDVVVVPYVMPGFDLARVVRELWSERAHDGTIGMVLCNHGLFTFGADSATAYRRHVDLISRAEAWLDHRAPTTPAQSSVHALPGVPTSELAAIRQEISEAAGAPMIVRRHVDPEVARFVARDDLASLAIRGPLTPDHVIRTKPRPLVGRDVAGYVAWYQAYAAEYRSRSSTEPTQLDPAPRLVLDPELGMLAVGRSAKNARIVADITQHTIPVQTRAEDHLSGYVGLSDGDLYDMEYWDLEQAKLRLGGSPPPLTGAVAIVTGAASGIGRACAAELMSRGGAVIGLDLDGAGDPPGGGSADAWLGIEVDVTDDEAVAAALVAGVERFGGIDIAVVAAGVFGPSAPLAELDPADWRSTMAVNVDAVATLFSQLAPLLAQSPIGGRVAVIGSKNVPAPGKGAAAYSASKAALRQLCRVAALEWADDGIRVNTVDPDAVFDTGLWTDDLIAERAQRYGLTPEEYRRRNLLSTEITSDTVARGVVALCTDDFAATTGAHVPVDGGSDRVI